MSSNRNKQIHYKHADLARERSLDLPGAVKGFSVVINIPASEHQMFGKHFRSDFIAILLVTRGEVTFGHNLTNYTVKENGLFVSAPNAIKQLISVKKETLFTTVVFTADFLGKIGMPKSTPDLINYVSTQFSPHWSLDNKDAAHLLNLMHGLKIRSDEFATHPHGKEILHHTFNIFLYEMSALSGKYAKQLAAPRSVKENLVMNFVNLVQKEFTFQRNVQQYASQLNITAKHLTETAKEITGKNAGEIIDDFVILEAKLLLDDRTLSIGEIADTLNFSNQSFFGKYFKRLTGVSPKEYRNTL